MRDSTLVPLLLSKYTGRIVTSSDISCPFITPQAQGLFHMSRKTHLTSFAVIAACTLGLAAPLQADTGAYSGAVLHQASVSIRASPSLAANVLNTLRGLPLVQVACTQSVTDPCEALNQACLDGGSTQDECAPATEQCLIDAGCVLLD